MPLLVGNKNNIVIERLRNGRTGAAITDAVLTAVITDTVNDNEIDSLTLDHEGSGDYSKASSAQITHGVEYKIQVDDDGAYGFRRVIIERGEDPEL